MHHRLHQIVLGVTGGIFCLGHKDQSHITIPKGQSSSCASVSFPHSKFACQFLYQRPTQVAPGDWYAIRSEAANQNPQTTGRAAPNHASRLIGAEAVEARARGDFCWERAEACGSLRFTGAFTGWLKKLHCFPDACKVLATDGQHPTGYHVTGRHYCIWARFTDPTPLQHTPT